MQKLTVAAAGILFLSLIVLAIVWVWSLILGLVG